jgi:2-aminomuconate deaminase
LKAAALSTVLFGGVLKAGRLIAGKDCPLTPCEPHARSALASFTRISSPFSAIRPGDKIAELRKRRAPFIVRTHRALSSPQDDITIMNNGTAYFLSDRAKPLAQYPHARRVNGFLFVSGTSSRRPDNVIEGATLRSDGDFDLDIRVQTKAVIENIRTILQASGADLAHLVDLTVFLTDMRHYAGFNEVYNSYFDAETGPTRTTVAVSQLPHPHLLIEIKALAVDPQAPGESQC